MNSRESLIPRLFLILCVWTTALHGGEVDLGHRTSGTPYDRYHGPVRRVFSGLRSQSASIESVRSNLRTARRFRYFFDPTNPYEPLTPEATEARQAGDCKAKALWLASKMGDANTRYTVGKPAANSPMSHAWLLWSKGGVWYALDPTLETDVLLGERIAGRKLFAHFSFDRGGAYLHPTYSTYVK